MEAASILTKISTFFSVLFASPFTIIPTIILLVFLYELFFRMHREDVETKYFFGLGIAACMVFVIVAYFSTVTTGLDTIITGILTEYYFPSMAIYMGIIVLAHIVVVLSMVKETDSSTIKKINVIFFAIIEILFFEFLYLIGKYKLSLTNINSIHSNEQLLIILEITMFVTFVWIMFGIGLWIVKYFVPELEKKKDQTTFPQVSHSQFEGVPLFPQEKIEIVKETFVEKEDIVRLRQLYEEEQRLVEEQLKYMLLLQEKEYEKLSGELHKLSQFARRKRELIKQLDAYEILLHNEKVEIEEEIELLLYIKKKEQEKIQKEIDKLLAKYVERNLE